MPVLSTTEIVNEIKGLEQICHNLNISFFSIGCVSNPEQIAVTPEMIKNTSSDSKNLLEAKANFKQILN